MIRDAKSVYVRETERAARLLGLLAHGPGVDAAIVEHCRRQVSLLTAQHGLPATAGELLDRVALCLDVEFVEIHSDEDLARLLQRLPLEVEPALARVVTELGEDTDAITIRRLAPQPWDRKYLAVINCRDWHFSRRFFTKWHELSHRLIDGEQLSLAFRRTPVERKDPGEILVDKVAGELAFFPEIVAAHAHRCLRESGLTFESVDILRQSVAPEASRQATTLALINYLDRPAWYLRCAVSLKLTETNGVDHHSGNVKPAPKLRVTEVSSNEAATRSGVRIHQWMRVPATGLVALAHQSGVGQTGIERLEEWETSSDGPIGYGQLFIDSQVLDDEVVALTSIARD